MIPGCVKIYNAKRNKVFGTGFFVSQDGYMITAMHVLKAGEYEIAKKIRSIF